MIDTAINILYNSSNEKPGRSCTGNRSDLALREDLPGFGLQRGASKIMSYISPISQLTKEEIPAAGGKGANLGEITSAGFPVPPGFVLTTTAYDAFVKEHGLQEQILALGGMSSDPQSSAEASERIKRLFLEVDIGDEVAKELVSAYEELGEIPVAVRSSATAEDLPQASFAGQQETFLNVSGAGALLEAVKACWASLWTARAMAYRERMGVEHEAAAMAVVVQAMVAAEISGILFTANPTSGEREELVVNASYGLGEAIVSGDVTPDTYVLDRQKMAEKESTLGTKEMMVISAAGQNTVTLPVAEALRSQSTLSADQLSELAELAVRVEESFDGVPQDIEWALADGQFWLLQARPITNLPPAPLKDVRWEPLRPESVWMRRQVVEHMPEPLSPLFDELYLEEGLDASMQSMADFMSDLSGLKIDIFDIIPPPFATSYNGYAYSIASFEISPKLIPFVMRIYVVVLPKMIRHLYPRWRDESLPAYRDVIAHWKGVDLASTRDEDLLRGIRELAHEDAIYWFAAAVPLGLARITDSVLGLFLKMVAMRVGSNGHPLTSGTFLWGFPSKAVEAQVQLEAIASKIRASDALREQVVKLPATRLLQIVAEHPDGQNVIGDLQRYLDSYGHQIYNLDFVTPTLADDPLPVMLSLKTAVEHPERDARSRQAQLAQERDALAARTERSLNPILRPVFRRLLSWAQRYAPIREEALFYVGAAWPALRRLALELGRRLTEAGSLNAADDVFYLRSEELTLASKARADGLGRPELAELAQERRELREARKRLDPPVVVPPDGRMKFGPIDMAMFEPKPREAGRGAVLEGFAVSPGQVTAPASVIHSPEEFDQMALDTILVCTTTTPAWTPLFAQAKGLVTDIGGALAHGSIVAREYGIPAVMGTGEATQRIKSGQLVQVDGDAGTVTLVDEIEPAAEEELPAKSRVPKKLLLALGAGAAIGLYWWKRRSRKGAGR